MNYSLKFLEFILVLLIGCGALLLAIDLRTKFDRALRYFGSSLVLISIMALIDINTGSISTPISEKLLGQQILHALACIFFPFSAFYLTLLTHKKMSRVNFILIYLGIFFIILVPFPLMLKIENNHVVGGWIYLPLFLPFAVFYIGFSYKVLISNIRLSLGHDKNFSIIHLIAFIILTLSGLMDMIGIIHPSFKIFISYKVFGIILFGGMSAFIFIERLFLLIKDRKEIIGKLDSIKIETTHTDALKSLGESSANIAHEIKNYLAIMKSNGKLIDANNLSGQDKLAAQRIEKSAERLESYTQSILNYSQKIETFKEEIIFGQFIKKCIQEFFPEFETKIQLSQELFQKILLADTKKLEQIFINIIKNSMDASATEIKVEYKQQEGWDCFLFVDNGKGCEEKNLEMLGKPFFSTKKNLGGNGLGLAVSVSIMTSFGGTIQFESSQKYGEGKQGLVVWLMFPVVNNR